MGWRRSLRSIVAASRQIERAQQRQRRALVNRQRDLEKLHAAEQAAFEVSSYENQVESLTSVHKDCSPTWDWPTIMGTHPPVQPNYSDKLEVAQRARERLHEPGIIDRLFGRADAKRQESERAIEQAKAADQSRYQAALKEYETSLADWRELQQIATGVIKNEEGAFKAALEELDPFKEIEELGRSVRLSMNGLRAEAMISLNGDDHVPRESKSLLKTNKVSAKQLSPAAIHELYRTHVCSCILRAARELFAVLPFREALVHGGTNSASRNGA